MAKKDYKDLQLEKILATNPMKDDYHTGIRTKSDIKTFDEAVKSEMPSYPDFTPEMAKQASKSGTITIHSSKPIKEGSFVSTSKMMAQDYAGGRKAQTYSKIIKLTDVAWINGDEGQYTGNVKVKTKEK